MCPLTYTEQDKSFQVRKHYCSVDVSQERAYTYSHKEGKIVRIAEHTIGTVSLLRKRKRPRRLGHGSQIIMDMNSVENLCKDLGRIKKFRENHASFGNMELEIEMPRKTSLSIISDRGEFSCYVVKKIFLCNKLIPLKSIMRSDKDISFNSLKSIVDYLKINLEIIEKG